MRSLFIAFIFFSSLNIGAQVSLGTSYFVNDRYVISYEKILNTDYSLTLDKFTIHTYLLGKKISSKPIRMSEPLIIYLDDYSDLDVRKGDGSETFDQWYIRLTTLGEKNLDIPAINFAVLKQFDSESLKIAWEFASPGSSLRMPDYTYYISPIFESGKYSYSIEEDTLRIYDAAYLFSLNLRFSVNEIIEESLNIFDNVDYESNFDDEFNFDYESFTLVKSGKISKIIRADLPLSESKSKRKSTLDNKPYQNEKLNEKEMMDNKYMERMKIKINEYEVKEVFNLENKTLEKSETFLSSRKLLPNEVFDIDGNVYKTTTIGGQTWMAENLRSTRFNNGVEIPILTNEQWANSTSPGIVNNDIEGAYYNFYTLASYENNVCPNGFRVPYGSDIENLYNTITPYYETLKVSPTKIKRRVYAPFLSPIAIPLFSAVHLGLWGGAATIDAALLGVAGVSDVALWSLQATAAAIDATVISPFFGWNRKEIDGKKIKSYNPFVLSKLYYKKFWSTTSWFLDSDYFSEYDGLFVNFNIMPYKKYSNEGRGKTDKKISVISLLFNKKTNKFADEYGFNLNFDNNIQFSNNKSGKSFRNIYGSTGISYLSFWSPAYWGINVNGNGKDSGNHELNRFYEIEGLGEIELMKLGTRIRCISEY